jgi:hypothetical protein
VNPTKTLRVFCATTLLATAFPALAEHNRPERAADRYVSAGERSRYERFPAQRRDVREQQVTIRRTVVVERPVVREVVSSRPVYVERPVVVHRPVIRELIVERPVYVERPYVVDQDLPVYRHYSSPYPVAAPRDDSAKIWGLLGGAIIGAVIGSQVADAEHRTAGAVAGAVLGGAIGNGL